MTCTNRDWCGAFAARLASGICVLACLAAAPRAAEEPMRPVKVIEADIEQINDDMEELKLWEELQRLGSYIPTRSRCGELYRWVREKFEELDSLNRQYENNVADERYQRRAAILEREKQDAIDEYLRCFAEVAATSELVRSEGLTARADFKRTYDRLEAKYGEGDIAPHADEIGEALWELQRELAAARVWHDWDMPDEAVPASEPIARATSVFGRVLVERGGGRSFALRVGDPLYLGDRVLTGPRGRARIEMDDRDERRDTGPTVLNVGTDSDFVMERFGRTPEPERGVLAGLVDLLQGTIRAFTQGFGGRAAFSVRTGTSVCGIRGTEVGVSYDPTVDEARYMLHHGSAVVYEALGEGRPLTPGTAVAVREGRLAGTTRIEPADYAALIRATDASGDPGQREALARARERFGEGSAVVKAQPGRGSAPRSARGRAAAAAFTTMHRAAQRNDIDAMLGSTAGELRSQLEARVDELGRRRFARTGWRPASWTLDCVECNDERTCYVFARTDGRRLEGAGGLTVREAYEVQELAGRWYPTRRFGDPDAYDEHVAACSWQ